MVMPGDEGKLIVTGQGNHACVKVKVNADDPDINSCAGRNLAVNAVKVRCRCEVREHGY
jgi:hypothetical protein